VIEALALASASNQVTQVGDGTDTRTFGYDAAGNVTSDTRYDGTVFSYLYDQRGRLAELKRNAVTEATYLVDARHLRVAKLSNVDSVHFLYDQAGHLLAEADATTGQSLREYLWLGNQPLSVVTDVGTASPRTHYIHTDHLGTPKMITRDDKTVAWKPTLTPFGELASVAGTLGFDLRLPGQYSDAESDLYQNWHREIDPALGRYMQADPIGLAGGTNLYGYAYANPVSYTDPTGQCPWCLAAGALGLAYGALEYGLAAADFHALLQDLLDPCKSRLEKAISAGVFAAGVGLPGGGYNVWLRHTPDQRALRELVDEATNRGRKPLSREDAETVLEWAQETNYPGVRAAPGDVADPSNWKANPVPHIHMSGAGRGGHVPVAPGVRPR